MPPTTNLWPSLDSSSLPLSPPLSPVFPNQLPPATPPEPSSAAEQGVRVNNRIAAHYILFIVLLVALVLSATLTAMLWYIHRRKQRVQEQTRQRGERAVSRHVERWGIYRRNYPPTIEGLNESGDAPPPYRPSDQMAIDLETIAKPELPVPI
ncbi:hypothetical protein C7974DRAFT_375242 [Boeremia exigua]|uniref:uncharacterized protein n=1 Tax=Boeremia exigua TaxID=749465 RepID=UPI001E8CF4DE|nr:uncharacterized protein C7974DRAFT_375242 [Boeremia exigua]KAH6633110.1 hypothetical protein C7974DRAFT_375242 [Boeremia exigua]